MLRYKKWMPFFGLLLILLTGLLSTYPKLIYAHAEYERSDPPADAVVREPPAEVHVWFSQELFRREGANTLEVFGPDGTQVDKGDARIDDDDRTHMLVSLQEGLPDGRYTVKWNTLSIDDGDTDSGEFSFTVDPTASGAAPTVEAQPVEETPTPAPSPTPLPSPTAAPQAGLPCLGGMVLGMVGLGIIASPRWRRRGGD